MWAVCVNQKCINQTVQQLGVRVGNQHTAATSPHKKGGKIVEIKKQARKAVFTSDTHDTLMSNGIFTWKVNEEREKQCLLLCSKNNI